MSAADLNDSANVEQLPCARKATVEEELNRILAQARDSCPSDAHISFDFDGQLHIHVDVRTLQQITDVQTALANSGGGLFHTFTLGSTPHHPFFHRVRPASTLRSGATKPRSICDSDVEVVELMANGRKLSAGWSTVTEEP